MRLMSRRAAGVGVAAVALVGAGVGIGAVAFSGDDGDRRDRGDRRDEATRWSAAPAVSVAEMPPVEEVPAADAERGTQSGSPLDDLPDGTTQLTDFGQRPDWSPDGTHVGFLDGSPLGDVWTVEVETGTTTNLTRRFEHIGFSRAAYLANGDLLLCGPTSGPTPTEERPESGRFSGVMSVLRAPFRSPPEPLGVPCWEGIATAGGSMRIAWNRSDIDYTDPDLADRVVNGITEVWTGEIRDVAGRATVVNAQKVLDRDAFGSLAVFEVQDFRPPDETELLLTAYAFQGGEVLGLDLETGEVRNYSSSSAYEEAEGVSTEGDAVYVERDLVYEGTTPGPLDVWRLDLRGSTWTRVTHFNRYAPYYASNPTVAPNGRRLAFQLSIDGESEGRGAGILLMDLGRDSPGT
jgi:hypothetical protein